MPSIKKFKNPQNTLSLCTSSPWIIKKVFDSVETEAVIKALQEHGIEQAYKRLQVDFDKGTTGNIVLV